MGWFAFCHSIPLLFELIFASAVPGDTGGVGRSVVGIRRI